MIQKNNEITSKWDDSRNVIWSSLEDALIFAASTAATAGKRDVFDHVYKQVYGKPPKHKQFIAYVNIAKRDLVAVTERARLSDGTPLKDALAAKFN